MRRYTLAFCLLAVGHLLHSQISVGVITDSDETMQSQLIIDALVHEIDKTTGVNLKVTTAKNMQYFNVQSEEEVQNSYENLNADLVLSIGGLSTKAMADLPDLPVPVIGIGVADPVLQGIPYTNRTSGKDNFTYILTSKNLRKEIKSFQKLASFERLSLLVDPIFSKLLGASSGNTILLDSLQADLGIQIELIESGQDVNEVIAGLASAEAVYLPGLVSKEPEYVQTISNYLSEQKVPSYSTSKQHVEWGILASSSGENSREQVLRRIGIMADDILSGRNAATISVEFSTKENFYLNIETARKMAFSVPFEVLLTANMIGESDLEAKVYSFAEIAEIALETNLDIQISYKDIDVAELDVRGNRSIMLPSLSSGLNAAQINEERANAAANSPERSLNLDLTLSQVIYSEEALASIKISQYLKKAQEFQTEVDILNVLFDTYSLYLDILSAKTNLAIQKQNLENTRTNLELAEIRVDLGSANNADLFRWESELATATQDLIESQAGLISAKLQLNNLLANSLQNEFDLKDIGIDDELFTAFKEGPLAKLVYTPQDLKIASDFLVAESLKQNPNKKQLLENIKVSERQLTLNKRLIYVPTVAFSAQTTEVLARGGAGSEALSDPTAAAFGAGLQDNSWSAGVSLTYPIFSGFSRRINKQRSQVELDQLQLSNTGLDQSLELNIRSGTVNLLSSTTNLNYSKIAAESALKNFKLIQSNYKAGVVNITQVIDAQQSALSAQLGAAFSVYEYILANLQVEYGLGFFSMFSTEDKLADFQNRFLEYVANNEIN